MEKKFIEFFDDTFIIVLHNFKTFHIKDVSFILVIKQWFKI
jgi:hypothetical protein